MKFSFPISFFLLIFFCSTLQAQDEIRFNHFSLEDGLSDKTVLCMLQDSKGYMWFGTRDGLSRFDGNSMNSYFHSNKDSSSLANNLIQCIYEDNLHTIWIGTYFGLSRFDPVKKNFTNYYFNKWSSKFGNSSVTNIIQDNKGALWISTGTGIYTAGPVNPKFSLVRAFSEDYYGWLIHGLNCTSNGRLFVLMDTALLFSDDYGKTFKTAVNYTISNHSFFTQLYQDKNEDLWFGDYRNQAIYVVNPVSFKVSKYLLDTLHSYNYHIVPYDFCRLNDSVMMVGTLFGRSFKYGGGLFFFNTNTHTYFNYYKENHNPLSLSSDLVWCIAKDNQNSFWIGTSDGVNSFNSRALNFHWSISENWDIPGLDATVIGTMSMDRTGTIWIGTEGDGLINYRPKEHSFSSYPLPFSPSDRKGRTMIFSIYPSNDSIYLGLGSGGYIIFNSKTHIFDTVPHIAPGIEDLYFNTVRGTRKDKNQTYWFITYGRGIYSYNPATKTGKHYFNRDSNLTSYHRNYDRCMDIDSKGNKWVGTYEDGFYCIESGTGNVIWNEPDDKEAQVIERGGINDIYCDEKGNTYIATQRDGLIIYDAETKKFKSVRNTKWPEDNKIKKIVPGENGSIWLVSSKGLSHWDLNNNKFFYYPEGNKLISTETVSGCAARDGTIYFSGDNNLLYFNPKEIDQTSPEIYPAITSLSLMNKEYLQDITKPVSISYRDNVVSFTFSAFDFLNEKQDQFAYYLQGFDNDWTYCRNRHFATYTNLPGGNYTLHLKVQNIAGEWIESSRPIVLHISTPYWKTWWFISLCALATFSLVYLIYYLQLQKKVEAEKIRTRLARDLHDDIGSSLSSISILSSLATKKAADANEETKSVLSRISQTSQKTLDSISDLVWTVNPDNDLMSDMLVRMNIYASEVLEPVGMNYLFTVSNEVGQIKLSMDKRKNFYLVFKEALNNLAKYSNCTEAEIKILKLDGSLITEIRDNGIGFEPGYVEGDGNGLKNMKQRALQMKGNLTIDSIPGEGTVVKLIFPIT